MKILVLNPILFSGVDNILPKVDTIKDTMIYSMCLGFKKLGYDVTLIAMEDYRPQKEENWDFEIIFVKGNLDSCLHKALPLSFDIWSFLKYHAPEYDIVLSSEVFSFHSLFASLIAPYKTIIWQELTTHQKKMHGIPSLLWHNIIARLLMRRVKAVVPRSKKAYDFISHYMPKTVETIVDHGISVEKFKFCRDKKRQIISSSQLIYRKNVDGIIRTFSKLHQKKSYKDVKLLIAGRGEEEQSLKALVADLKLQANVVFLGFLPQATLNEYIKESYCFLVNTRQDLNMVSIPESIVSGTPILTNMIPASADYIKREHLGIAKDNWNENDIMELIENNSTYVDKCISYREKLTSVHSAQLLVDIFLNE